MSDLISSTLFTSRAKRSDDNMIPLINIVFLLLVFYMIAGEITAVMDDHVDPPLSSSMKALEGSSVVLALDSENSLSINGQSIEPDLLTVKLLEVTGGTPIRVVLKADKDVKAANLDRLLRILREHHVTTVTLLSKPIG